MQERRSAFRPGVTSCGRGLKVDLKRNPTIISDYRSAVAYLDSHIGRGVKPGLERMAGLLSSMGDPHQTYPSIHIAGTNGKTSATRSVADLLGAHGLNAGAFISPHLQRIEERFSVAGRMLNRAEFVTAVADVAPFVGLFEEGSGESVTYFELTAAIAFAAFADASVDAAAIEVGLGGRLDATNVLTSAVAVITSIGLDHTNYLGGSLASIATEKVAILDPGAPLVTGPLPPAAEGPITARVSEMASPWLRYGADFGPSALERKPDGWLMDVDGVYSQYHDISLHLRGRHQVSNFVTAIAATEALFGRALDPAAVREAAAGATSPGRLEKVGEAPTILLDGAHNREGLESLEAALAEEFPGAEWTLVLGMRGERDVASLIDALQGSVASVVATAAADPGSIPAAEVAEAARSVFGDIPVSTVDNVADAIQQASDAAGPEGSVLVTGSLYVVGEARTALVRELAVAPSAHTRIEAIVDPDEGPTSIDLTDASTAEQLQDDPGIGRTESDGFRDDELHRSTDDIRWTVVGDEEERDSGEPL